MASSSTEYAFPKTSSHSSNDHRDDNGNDDAVVEKLSQHLAELNSKFCDQFSRQLEQVFGVTIPDFPRLEHPEALLQRLEKSYLRNVDVVEVYASRNIFTLDNLPVNRRGRIAQLYFSTKKSTDVTLALKKATPESLLNTPPNNSNANLEKITSKPAVRKEEVETKRQAVQELEKKVAAAKQQRDALQRRVGELEVAQKLAAWKNDPVSTAEYVQTTASTLMEDVHGLNECQAKGEEAKQQAKKRRVEEKSSSLDQDDSDGLTPWNHHPLASKSNTVHDLYHKEQKRVQTTKEDLQALHRMLVGDKK